MFYAIMFILVAGEPHIQMDPKPYVSHKECAKDAKELFHLYSSHVDYMAITCQKLPIRPS